MTPRQIELAKSLERVTFQVGSYNKRFCRDMAGLARLSPAVELTEKQAALLEQMYHRYRRQIPNHKRLCSVCAEAKA